MGCACRCCSFIPPIPSTSTRTTPPTTSGGTGHVWFSPSSLGLRKSEPESKSDRRHGRAFPPPLRSGNLGTFYSSMFLATSSPSSSFSSDLLSQLLGSGHNNSNNNNNYGGGSGNGSGSGNGNGGGGFWNNPLDDGGREGDNSKRLYLFLLSALGCFFWARARARARVIINSNEHAKDEGKGKDKGNGKDKGKDDEAAVWVVKGGKWTRLVPDLSRNADDAFVGVSAACRGDADDDDDRLSSLTMRLSFFGQSLVIVIPRHTHLCLQCRNLFVSLMLPQGFPHSVTSDYLDYSLWRGVQGVSSQITAVLATQSLLLAVGLGKGAIPAAAAVSWVLKDGIGYLSKILLSKYGRHFDVNPKGWRLFADLLENAAFGLEISTPAFPHLFVFIGAAAGAVRSASALIQAATRSCFYAGFAAQRNFAEVIAKGEAQGMVSKSIGIMLGIPLAHCIGSSTPLALVSFGVVTWIHMFCNLKSYQSIQLRTLNPFRASLVFSEYLLSGQVPSNIEVNNEEPIFPALPFLHLYPIYKVQPAVLSGEAKDAAAEIEHRLQLGSKLSDVVYEKEDALALFYLYRNEDYILIEHKGNFCVILKETSSPQDMLKSLFHVNYLYWLEKQAGIKTRGTSDDCRPGGRLQTSLEYVQREFNHVRRDGESVGWITDGLVARPFPNRIRPGNASNAVASC